MAEYSAFLRIDLKDWAFRGLRFGISDLEAGRVVRYREAMAVTVSR